MPSSTRTAILDATLALLGETTLSRLSLEKVAAEAGVSRQTLYRYFGNREGLLTAVIVREEERLLEELEQATEATEGLHDGLAAAIQELLEWTRDHPLLMRLLAEDPQVLVPLLTTGAGPVLTVARPVVEAILTQRLAAGSDVAATADVLTRLMISYSVNPPTRPPNEAAPLIADILINGFVE